jgi:hypothetical protein
MQIDLNSQYEHAGVKTYSIDSIYSPDEIIELTRPSKDNDVTMKEQVKKAKSLSNSAGRKFSAQSNISTDFKSSIHSNSNDRKNEDNRSNFT